jgi:hypothetical protein
MQATAAERTAWKTAVAKSGCAITTTGLWVSVSLKHNWNALSTISKQTGVPLSNPPAC